MPSRVNGIGTWYWGRNNIIARSAKCEFCGNTARLTSYDTTLFFTLLFVPLIPLQRKRVLNQCSRCRRHRVIPLKKWEEQKTAALVDALNAWQADRSNAEKARQAVNVTIGYQDHQAFEDLSSSVGQAFARDADMQLFLAGGHDHFNHPAAAENAYRAAVAARNDPAMRRAYAAYLMRQLRPDDAKPLLQDIVPAKDRDGIPLLLLEAQAYQAVGNHVAAASLLDDAGTTFPDLLNTPDYQRISGISTKYRGTSKRIKAATFDPNQRGGARNASWFHRNGAKLVISTIVAVAAAWYLIEAANSAHHKVFVVNRTSLPYVAIVDGSEHHIPAKSELPLDLDEGVHTVNVQNHPEIDSASFKLQTNFWTRPFNHRTFVINPDRAALLYDRDVQYSAHPTGNAPPPKHAPAFYVGEVIYNLKEPDDAFVEPPKTVDLSSDTAIVTRRHLSQLSKLSLDAQLELIQLRAGAAAAKDWMKRLAATSDDGGNTMGLLSVLGAQLEPAEMIAFLRPRLADRPVRVLWHRIYQSMMEKQHPDYDLAADYRAQLAKNPDDSALIYLTGRSMHDRNEMLAMFNKAASAPKPCAYALYALAYEDLGQAHFPEALPKIQAALRLEPSNIQFIAAQAEVCEALHQTNSAVDLAKSQETHDGTDRSAIGDEVRLLAVSGSRTAALERINSYCSELQSLHFDQEEVDAARNMLTAEYSYAIGDIPAFKTAVKDVKSPEVAWQVALIDGDYQAAEQLLKDSKHSDYEQYLVLSALSNAKDHAVSDRAWTKANALLAVSGYEERALAAKLSAGAPPPPQTALQNCPGYPIERCAFLTCLGQRHPEEREGYFAIARTMNFSTQFPHREFAAALAAK